MRLIDADALWTDIMMLPHNGDMISSEEVEQEIKDAPTVEVVRCKDCRQWSRNISLTVSPLGRCFYRDAQTHELDFCSDGERRGNGTTQV